MQTPWWKRLPSRLLEEERELSKLREGETPITLSHHWVRGPEGEPMAFVQMRVASRTIELEVRFPTHYPEGCPSVRPVPHDMRISTHQFKRTGILCLELGPDNWHPRYTSADMIRSAWKLVASEMISTFEPIEIPSRHDANLAERIALSGGILLRSSDFEDRLRDAVSNTEFEVIWPVRHLSQVLPVAFPKDVPLVAPPAMVRTESRFPGLFVRLRKGAPESVPDDRQEFRSFVLEFGQVSLEDVVLAVLLQWSGGKTRAYLQLTKDVMELENFPLDMPTATRIPGALQKFLLSLKVGIVGLGSLGSKVATSLARSGVRRFVLIDGDVMQPDNVCRHSGTITDVGSMKVEAAMQGIRDVSTTAPEVIVYALNLGAPTSPEFHGRVLEALGACDVLVDATANADVFGLMAGLASDQRRTLVWGEVFVGGLGGLVASAHPEQGPCPRCVRAGFLAVAASWPDAPFGRPDTPYGGSEDSPLVATDADVSFIAAALTNRIYDLILREEFRPPAVMLMGLRRGWIFDSQMQVVPVQVRSDDRSCDRCWRPPAEPDPEAAACAEKLFTDQVDAYDPSSR